MEVGFVEEKEWYCKHCGEPVPATWEFCDPMCYAFYRIGRLEKKTEDLESEINKLRLDTGAY